MISISACMIVKNEEAVLERCLLSVAQIADEIIIVDTGSTDRTKEIAAKFTDQIYDFTWVNDFSKARNFSFSKATKDYIYTADADEVIDEENIARFLQLKKAMLPEIEIVQMFYANQLEFNTTYNFDKEYRPKLYKRLREFTWQDPLHEAVRLEPVIYDSEIEICHMPTSNHASRDFGTFLKLINQGERLSSKLRSMYARELFIAGNDQDFIESYSYFTKVLENEPLTEKELRQCQCVIARGARLQKDRDMFFKVCLKNIAMQPASAEVCFELGAYYQSQSDEKEATIWFYNAAYETEAELNIRYQKELPLYALADCYRRLGDEEQAKAYDKLARQQYEK